MEQPENTQSKGIGLVELAGPRGQLWKILDDKGKRRIWLLFGLMVFAAVIELATLGALQAYVALLTGRDAASLPWIGPYIDPIIGQGNFIGLTALMTGVLVFKMLVFAGVYWVMASSLARQRVRLSRRLFNSYLHAPYSWHLLRPTAELQRNLREDVTQVINSAVLPFLQLLLSTITGLAIFGFILVTLPPTVLGGLLLAIVLFLGISTLTHRQLVKSARLLRRETARMIASILQGFGALTEARILDRRAWFLKQFEQSTKGVARAQKQRTFLYQTAPVAVETALMIAMMIIIGIMLINADSLQSALELATVLAFAVFRLKQVLSKATMALNKISSATPSLAPLISDIETLAPNVSQALEQRAVNPLHFERLDLAKVGFTFPGAKKPALRGVDLTIDRGAHLAILGSTGAGKSTLMSLILGLIEPSEGEALVNGKPIVGQKRQWRAGIGYVPQSIYLVDGTIASNIALGVNEDAIDMGRVAEAADVAGLTRFIAELPDGFATRSGEQGSWLSGGQRQRIGIARALYGRPEMLVLDEATSALDRVTEAEILARLYGLSEDLTILTITHKLETVKGADRVIYLENGAVGAQGSYQDVANASAAFREASGEDATELAT